MAGGCKSFVIAEDVEQYLKAARQIGDFAPAAAEETLLNVVGKMGPIFQLLNNADIHVKLTGARCMKKLRQRMPNFLMKVRESDAERVRQALAVAREEELDRPNDEEYQELVELLEFVIDGGTEVFRSRLSPKHEPKDAPAAVPYGQVVLQVKPQMEGDARAALLNQILLLDGVVSVTFEDGYVIIATRSVATADPTFLSKLMSALGEQGLVGELFSVGEATGAMGAPNAHPFASASAAGSSSTSSTGIPTEADREDENQAQAEPTYLDDELNDGFDGNQSAGYPSGAPGGAGVPQWTFFSQRNWMMERRLQEYEDDPNVAARLANKKKQQQKKQKEDAKHFRWLASWIGLREE